MADIAEKIGPIVEGLVAESEKLEGYCVGSRQGLMSGKFVTVVVTDGRVIVQETDRKAQRPKGEGLALTPELIEKARVGGAGGWGGDIQASIMNKTSLAITIRTTAGEKVKLMVGKATGPLGGLMGGDTQENGVNALVGWLDRHGKV
jgi:hypothetical protein